jgi:hypothetical protein
MDHPWIEFTKWPYEPEMWHVELAASDGDFSVRQEFYANVADIVAFGTALQAFPRGVDDEAILEAGRKDPAWAHWVALRAYLYDRTGHAGVTVDVGNNAKEPYRREARFTIRCEVASLNRLGQAVVAWMRGDEQTLRVELTPVGA